MGEFKDGFVIHAYVVSFKRNPKKEFIQLMMTQGGRYPIQYTI